MNVTVRLFARARDVVGQGVLEVDLPEESTIADLRRHLVEDHAKLESLASHLLFALGTEYVTDETPLGPGDEVAVFPPVSGG